MSDDESQPITVPMESVDVSAPSPDDAPVSTSDVGSSIPLPEGPVAPPDVQYGGPTMSNLPNVGGAPQQPVLNENGTGEDASQIPPVGGRMRSILGALLTATTTGIEGAGQGRGRQNFASGASLGAAAQLQYQFQTAADATRAAQLTMDEKKLQLQTQQYQDEHDKNQQEFADHLTQTTGQQFQFVPNDDGGKSVMNNFKGQMNTQGGISVPVGTVALSSGWLVPVDGTAQQAQANTKTYNDRAKF